MRFPNSAFQRRALFAFLPLLLIALLWRVASKRPTHLSGLGGRVTALTFSSDSQTLICATDNHLVQVWKPDIKKWRSFVHDTYNPIYGDLTHLVITRDERTLIGGGIETSSSQPQTHMWDMKTRCEYQNVGFYRDNFDVTSDGTLIASAFPTGVWIGAVDLSKGRTAYSSPAKSNLWPIKTTLVLSDAKSAQALAFSPDGKTLAVLVGGELQIYDLSMAKNKQLVALKAQSAGISSTTGIAGHMPMPGAAAGSNYILAWSPDGNFIAAANESDFVLWRADGTKLGILASKNSAVMATSGNRSIAFAPDNRSVAIADAESVQQESVPDLKPLCTIHAPGPIAFSPDGKTLASGGANGSREVLLWPL